MAITTDVLLNKILPSALSSSTKVQTSATEFATELQRKLMEDIQTQKAQDEIQTNSDVEEFKRELTSMGALQFLQSYNFEKIEALMDKKKEELMESLGLSETTQPPLTGEALSAALDTLEEALRAYQEELMQSLHAEDTLEKDTPLLSSLLEQF